MKDNRNSNEQRFEFLLYINDHIIVQRYFNIIGYNEQVRHSMDMRWLVDDCIGLIKEDLHDKTVEHLWGRFNPYMEQKQEQVPTESVYDKKHTFTFEIKIDKETTIKGDFDGSIYPPAVRYQIDIKSIIPDITYLIRKTLSSEKISKKYLDTETATVELGTYLSLEKMLEWGNQVTR